ncbi:hypothetical protein MRA01_28040 [Methylobacterium radiotolerans]|nr:hypothetical protein MRA01_28040 [Methylobacterium radiotolerans]
MGRRPGDSAGEAGDHQAVDFGVRHQRLKLRDPRLKLGNACAQAVELGALPLAMLTSAVGGIAPLPD